MNSQLLCSLCGCVPMQYPGNSVVLATPLLMQPVIHSKVSHICLTSRHWLKASISLVIVMGITWIIGILVFNRHLLFVAYIYTIFIGLQGLIIFILFVVLSKQVEVLHCECDLHALSCDLQLSTWCPVGERGIHQVVEGEGSFLRLPQ